MKIGMFGILNNPQYRQEPWWESIRQNLECFDCVSLVCARQEDIDMIRAEFPNEEREGRLWMSQMDWPFPEWSYEMLPMHLNAAMRQCKRMGCDWGVKLDVDTVLHEKDIYEMRSWVKRADAKGKWAATIEKYQFFKPTRCYEKGKIPLFINLKKSIAYGFDIERYTDLCQPIKWDTESKAVVNGKKYDTPLGHTIPADKMGVIPGVHVWNYDYTLRTKERAIELLYWIEKAHDKFWGKGYVNRSGDDITRESAFQDFINLSMGRWQKMNTEKKIEDHPKYFQDLLRKLKPEQWGYDLWGHYPQEAV